MRFYLAGGMRGEPWQDKVRELLPGHGFIDPMHSGLKNPADFTQWDVGGVAICDGIIAYMEEDNPSGIGLTLEIGLALGMGKPVWFANESTASRWKLVEHAVGSERTFCTLGDLCRSIAIATPTSRSGMWAALRSAMASSPTWKRTTRPVSGSHSRSDWRSAWASPCGLPTRAPRPDGSS